MYGRSGLNIRREWNSGRAQMFGIGPMEMVIVAVIALLLFGKRLPEVAKSLGRSLVEFKKGMNGEEDRPTGTPVA